MASPRAFFDNATTVTVEKLESHSAGGNYINKSVAQTSEYRQDAENAGIINTGYSAASFNGAIQFTQNHNHGVMAFGTQGPAHNPNVKAPQWTGAQNTATSAPTNASGARARITAGPNIGGGGNIDIIPFRQLSIGAQREKVASILAESLLKYPGFYNSEDIHRGNIILRITAQLEVEQKYKIEGEAMKEMLRFIRQSLINVEETAAAEVQELLGSMSTTDAEEIVAQIDTYLKDYTYIYKAFDITADIYRSDIVLKTFARVLQLLPMGNQRYAKSWGGLAFAANAVHRALHLEKARLSGVTLDPLTSGITMGFEWHPDRVQELQGEDWAAIIRDASACITGAKSTP